MKDLKKFIQKHFTENKNSKGLVFLLVALLASNFLTFQILNRSVQANKDYNNNQSATFTKASYNSKSHNLFLMDQARSYVSNENAFEQKVRDVSSRLDIAPEWLMAVMHSESRFDASVKNRLGSGATGLIQFMPATAKDFSITTDKLRNMNHVEQLDYVYDYLDRQRKNHKEYRSLTDLYLAILYPKAMSEEYCYTMYAQPSKAYKMNSGLDEDKDGRVTVQDIDKRMKRIYPTAYVANKPGTSKMISGF